MTSHEDWAWIAEIEGKLNSNLYKYDSRWLSNCARSEIPKLITAIRKMRGLLEYTCGPTKYVKNPTILKGLARLSKGNFNE